MAEPFGTPIGAAPMHPIYGASGQTRPDTDSEALAKAKEKPDEAWRHWMSTIHAAMKVEQRWRQEAEDAERRYFGDDTEPLTKAHAMSNTLTGATNLAHSTIDVLRPIMYSQPPSPIVRRRFQGDGEDDPVDRFVAEVAQRLLHYLIDCTDFHDAMESSRDDWLIPGRGWARACYEAEVEEAVNADTGQLEQRVTSESTYLRYWPWRDVVMSPAPSWLDVRWIAYRHYMAREDALKKLDPDIVDKMNFRIEGTAQGGEDDTRSALEQNGAWGIDDTQEPRPLMGDVRPRAVVWEVWVKEERKVLWIAEGYDGKIARIEDDPYGFKGFFDCPKPLIASARGQTMTPRPDMAYYIQQLDAIDLASKRLNSLLAKIRVHGFYPGNHDALLSQAFDRDDHGLTAVPNWLAFIKQGGKDLIQWLPLQQWAQAAELLDGLLQRKKQELFEISGISDAMRGQGDPNRTATQDKIQGRYGGLKISTKQRRMATFVRDGLRLLLEMSVEQFDAETIAGITNLDLPWTEEERAQRSAMVLGPNGQPMPADPTFKDPGASWEVVLGRLQDDLQRAYSVSIETDSTILEDENEDREARIQFITAFQQFVAGMAPIVMQVPGSWPLVKSLLLFGVRGFRKARLLENHIEDLPDELPEGAGGQGPSREEMQMKIKELEGQIKQQIEAEKQRFEATEAEKARAHEVMLKGMDTKVEAVRMAHEDERERDRVAEDRDRMVIDLNERERERAVRQAEKQAAGAGNGDPRSPDRGSALREQQASAPPAIVEALAGLQEGQRQLAAAIAALASRIEGQAT